MAREPDYFDFLDACEHPSEEPTIGCRRCGFIGEWAIVPTGRGGHVWRIFDGGAPHRCGPAAEDEFSADPLNTP